MPTALKLSKISFVPTYGRNYSFDLHLFIVWIFYQLCECVITRHWGYCTTEKIFVFLSFIAFFFLVTKLHDMWDLSCPTRGLTHTPALEVWSLTHGSLGKSLHCWLLCHLLVFHTLPSLNRCWGCLRWPVPLRGICPCWAVSQLQNW